MTTWGSPPKLVKLTCVRCGATAELVEPRRGQIFSDESGRWFEPQLGLGVLSTSGLGCGSPFDMHWSHLCKGVTNYGDRVIARDVSEYERGES